MRSMRNSNGVERRQGSLIHAHLLLLAPQVTEMQTLEGAVLRSCAPLPRSLTCRLLKVLSSGRVHLSLGH